MDTATTQLALREVEIRTLAKNGRESWREHFEFADNHLIIHGKPTIEQCQEMYKFLEQIEKGRGFWLGDLIIYMEKEFSESASQVFDVTGLIIPYGSMKIAKYVSNSIPPLRRRNTSFAVHYEVANLVEEEQDKILDKAVEEEWTVKETRQRVKEHKRAKLIAERSNGGEIPDSIALIQGDFREIMANMPTNSVDMIFTDPPYDNESIPLYRDLAKLGGRVLKPGGSLITYVGHYAIPQITRLMDDYLRYWWILNVNHSGSAARLIGKNVFVEWKPLLWYVKDHRRNDVEWVADMVDSDTPTKNEHDWQQGYKEADYYIDKLTFPGDVVLDPFAGSGTTLISAHRLKRQAIGIEIDGERTAMARIHIQTECGSQTS